jgi:EAL domain-containing protein (putative c-di-GMP-specific phosphodiesterase class I)
MNVLVEGVETAEQEQKLLALGCDSGQGYLYSKPMPANEFYDGFLSEHS